MAEPLRPSADRYSAVPDRPAKVVGVRPDLPDNFKSGDGIVLWLRLDRVLSALETRILHEQARSEWDYFVGSTDLRVELSRVVNGTLGQFQAVLDEVNSRAAEEAKKAEMTRSQLAELIAGWGL